MSTFAAIEVFVVLGITQRANRTVHKSIGTVLALYVILKRTDAANSVSWVPEEDRAFRKRGFTENPIFRLVQNARKQCPICGSPEHKQAPGGVEGGPTG